MNEYAIWGTRNGEENIVRVNGEETQKSLVRAKKIVSVLRKRGEFSNLRIQTINLGEGYNPSRDFQKAIRF